MSWKKTRCCLHMFWLLLPPMSNSFCWKVCLLLLGCSAHRCPKCDCVLAVLPPCAMTFRQKMNSNIMRCYLYTVTLTSAGVWGRLQSALPSCFSWSGGPLARRLTPVRTGFFHLLSFGPYLVPGCVPGSTQGNNFRGNFVAIGRP